MGSLGVPELLVIAGIALLLFGAGRIADVGKGFGLAIRNFKQGVRDDAPSPQESGNVNEAPSK